MTMEKKQVYLEYWTHVLSSPQEDELSLQGKAGTQQDKRPEVMMRNEVPITKTKDVSWSFRSNDLHQGSWVSAGQCPHTRNTTEIQDYFLGLWHSCQQEPSNWSIFWARGSSVRGHIYHKRGLIFIFTL